MMLTKKNPHPNKVALFIFLCSVFITSFQVLNTELLVCIQMFLVVVQHRIRATCTCFSSTGSQVKLWTLYSTTLQAAIPGSSQHIIQELPHLIAWNEVILSSVTKPNSSLASPVQYFSVYLDRQILCHIQQADHSIQSLRWLKYILMGSFNRFK